MNTGRRAQVRPIGVVRSVLKTPGKAGTPVVDIKPVLAGPPDC